MDFYNTPRTESPGELTSFKRIIPCSDDIDEVVQQHELLAPQLRALYRRPVGYQFARFERPIRRRLKADDPRVKLHRTFSMSTVPAVGLRGGLDPSELSSSSSPVTIVTSATSSAGTPWSTSGRVEEIFEDEGGYDWQKAQNHRPDDGGDVIPKLEPIDDLDMDMGNSYGVEDYPMPIPPLQASPVEPKIKRPRGRPRKHEKQDPRSMTKVHKGRSKTGCFMCRDRKKKCDETKPGCENCKKIGHACPGYPELKVLDLKAFNNKQEKTIKEPPKRKKTQDTIVQNIPVAQQVMVAQRRSSYVEIPSFPLPSLFHGVETDADRIFFKYYLDHMSLIYTVEGETGSRELSSFRTLFLPEAQGNKGLMHSMLSVASRHIDYESPYGRQIFIEYPHVKRMELRARSDYHYIAAQQTLLKRITEYSTLSPGEQAATISATHLQIVLRILETINEEQPKGEHRLHLKYSQNLPKVPDKPEVQKFLDQFYNYHIFADQIISLSPLNSHYAFHNEWNLPSTIIHRDAVPLLGVSDSTFMHMSKVTNLRNRIRENLESGIEPAVGYPAFYNAVDIEAGIRAWEPVWPAGDPRELNGKIYQNMIYVYLLRTIYPPRTYSGWLIDPRIIEAVDRGIVYLGLIGPGSRYQTTLLAPTFVIGCAAFETRQRVKIREAIGVIRAYMGMKNTELALSVLEEVWRLMDLKDERSWDWQTIAFMMGRDFLAT